MEKNTISNILVVILVVTIMISSNLSNLDRSWAESLVDTINVGDAPFAIEFNPSNNDVYVANLNSGTVSVIDSSTNTVTETISLEDEVHAIEFNPSNNEVYMVKLLTDTVSIIDGTTNEVTDTINVGDHPRAIEFNPSNNDVYVANQASDTVSIIDGTTNEVTDTISVGDAPFAIEFNPSNNEIYVVNTDSDNVSVIGSLSSFPSKPVADAGPDQSVQSGNVVRLDGSNSSDPNDSQLSYSWTQTSGPEVKITDSNSTHPTFSAPNIDEDTALTFQLTVTNEMEYSEPDTVTITVNPVISPPPDKEPKTIGDLVKGILQKPLDMANSIDSSNQIKDILTDNNPDNDQLVCDLIYSETEYTSNIRHILNC